MATIAKANKMTGDVVTQRKRSTLAEVASHSPKGLITYRISVLAQMLSRVVDASVRDELGLTSRQWRMLVVLNHLGTSKSGEVARMCNFDHSQVSRVAFELAEKGLITQTSDTADRRKLMLSMTPAGVDCMRSGLPISLERQARLRGRMNQTQYENFCRSLDALEDEVSKLLGESKDEV